MLNNRYANSKIALFAEKWLPFLTAVLIPLYPMLYLYSQGDNAEYLSIIQVLMASLVFMLGSMVLFLIAKKLMKSPQSALLVCISAWVVFFSYLPLFNRLHRSLPSLRHRYSLLIVALMLAFLWFFFWRIGRIQKIEALSFFISVLLVILLIMNIGMSMYKYFSLKDYEGLSYKTDFFVDDTLLTPNIYWFHCDGMLGFDAMEKYYGDSQEQLTQELESRGFLINRGAYFDGQRSTQVAMPSLMNPSFYDMYMSNRLSKNKSLTYDQLSKARENNELVLAFSKRSYHTATFSGIGIYLFPITDVFYDCNNAEEPILMMDDANKIGVIKQLNESMELLTLLRITTPLIDGIEGKLLALQKSLLYSSISGSPIYSDVNVDSIVAGETRKPYYETMARCLDEALNVTAPKLFLFMYGMAHSPYSYDENGSPQSNSMHIRSYPSSHKYANKVLVNFIDMILERDPNAIIVLQADHGLHTQTEEQIAEGLSVAVDAAPDIWNSVMSAVRIPEQYGELEEPLHPLDITRYLVNNYVGENYEYLEGGNS